MFLGNVPEGQACSVGSALAFYRPRRSRCPDKKPRPQPQPYWQSDDPYAVLGVPPGSDIETCKAAGRTLVLLYRPDQTHHHRESQAILNAYRRIQRQHRRQNTGDGLAFLRFFYSYLSSSCYLSYRINGFFRVNFRLLFLTSNITPQLEREKRGQVYHHASGRIGRPSLVNPCV